MIIYQWNIPMVYREKYSVISKEQMDFKTFISLKKYI